MNTHTHKTCILYTRSVYVCAHGTICTCMCRTHCRYPHIQILHCKVPFSPVHQGGSLSSSTTLWRMWQIPIACHLDRQSAREKGRQEGKEGGRKQHINAMTLAVLLGHCARMSMNEMTWDTCNKLNMDELIHKPMNQPINQWIGCVYAPDNFTIHVTRHQMRWHDLGATYQAIKTRWHRWTIIGPSFTNEMSQQT